MRAVVTLLVTAVLSVGLWFLLSNAHVDIFPCERAFYDYQTEQLGPAVSETCSLLGVLGPQGEGLGTQKLTLAGYAVYGLVVAGVPLLIGLLVGRRFGAKKAEA